MHSSYFRVYFFIHVTLIVIRINSKKDQNNDAIQTIY